MRVGTRWWLAGAVLGLLLMTAVGTCAWRRHRFHTALNDHLAEMPAPVLFHGNRQPALPAALQNRAGELNAAGWQRVQAALQDSQPISAPDSWKELGKLVVSGEHERYEITLYPGNVFTFLHPDGSYAIEGDTYLKNPDAVEGRPLQCNQDLLGILQRELQAEHPDWR